MRKQLLLVDDEPGTLLAFRRLLEGPRVRVDTAVSLQEANSFLMNNLYDIIVSDLRLSGTFDAEGFDIIRIAREQNPAAKVILVTAYGNPDDKERAFHLGASIYLEKPVLAVELKKAIASLGVEL